jgi:acetolactate synthase-1/2/3 large subunit
LEALLQENVDTIFGYPGGAIMPIYDALYDYSEKLKHILVRHEQGAIHAAQGFARTSGKRELYLQQWSRSNQSGDRFSRCNDRQQSDCLYYRSGFASLLGTDAFQETDVINITTPVTKWNYQVTDATEIRKPLPKLFISKVGRPVRFD